ncbi:hydroxyacid dehydrogenase [Nocardia vaccinii]|uniref:hydroxyacid dehydrogenase n=1 Tax=Nocardia vaccinii TaxID=1822 RepID=UPI00082E86F1|nr:hydroxyacid dehydrogenase [Nocardia vaccinii]
MKVAMVEIEQEERPACARLEPGHEVIYCDTPLTIGNADRFTGAEVLSPFVDSQLDVGLLARLPRLRLIATRSSGVDHIDLDYCAAHGITVCNVPDYGDSTVAEHVFALLLCLARHTVDAADRTRRGGFSRSGLRGFELQGKVLGVIGTGRIGRRVIEIAHGFGMTVVATDIRPDRAVAQRWRFRYAALEDVLSVADVVTLHVPATADTVHLISDREFAMMKTGVVVINTARGPVIDVAALIRALSQRRVAAAGLDVLPEEPAVREEAEIFHHRILAERQLKTLVADHVLLGFPNVLVTPHIAYYTGEALHRIIETTLSNIEAFAGGEPRNVVVSAPVSGARDRGPTTD